MKTGKADRAEKMRPEEAPEMVADGARVDGAAVLEDTPPRTAGAAGRGRPPGRRNSAPTSAAKGVPRKAPGALQHKGKAVQRDLLRARKVREAENAERRAAGLAPLPEVPAPDELAKQQRTEPRYSPPECRVLAVGVMSGVGLVLGVEARPAEKDLDNLAEALSRLSIYYDFLDPRYMAIAGVGMASFACVGPMWAERRERKRREAEEGEPEPRSVWRDAAAGDGVGAAS